MVNSKSTTFLRDVSVSETFLLFTFNFFSEILDDLADGIDRTTVGLINETHQVRTIARKDSTCGKKCLHYHFTLNS